MANINPATETVLHHFAAGSAEDVDEAVMCASRAFTDRWGRTTGTERAKYMRNIAKLVMERKSELAREEALDVGKPLAEAEWDVDDVASCFELYATKAEDLDKRHGTTVALPDEDYEGSLEYMPVGVVAAIIPWNYPALMLAWKVAPALAAGCCVVVKPSELTPTTALSIAKIGA